MSTILVSLIVFFVVLALNGGIDDAIDYINDSRHTAFQKRCKDIITEFEELAREHRRTPKGGYDCTFKVYDKTHQMRGGSYSRMCVDRHGETIYNDGCFDYKQESYIRQYIIEMKDEIAHLKMKEDERIWKITQAQKKAAIEREEDLRLHPWKKHRCSECGYYSWKCYPDGDSEAKCGYTGYIYSSFEVSQFSSRTACEHYK